MQTLLSGLSEQASRAYVGASFDDAFSIQWKPAAQFMAGVDLTSSSGHTSVCGCTVRLGPGWPMVPPSMSQRHCTSGRQSNAQCCNCAARCVSV